MMHEPSEQCEYHHPVHMDQPSVLSFSQMPPYTYAEKEIGKKQTYE